ncbi:hypothetical protein, conserved [Trypanosoma brucei gambiense DAL972]|uniref:MPN domain-containing protein n=1 Tax=Trypanosoma brucei gambiense (strain MHOM/CI/86/DAL972) TaxID=679716 RepID=C9ZK00_TRYB9|nr:hypothetical protein, conserved [Trypanosoma brucei gambiense DAL972]CBH09764.1 hypothetical protein, conserved [Trypanosoma brucei gambiense DAL972]|eukprot:XP_011772057.1 hypothetical protein, conserved [Trypanosoma brucei gambiense DAL972]
MRLSDVLNARLPVMILSHRTTNFPSSCVAVHVFCEDFIIFIRWRLTCFSSPTFVLNIGSDLALDNIFDFLIKDIALNRGAAYLLCPVHRFLFMADASALEELRKERQRRYAQLSRTEKPRIEPCCHCNEPPYKERVCPVTGVYHNHDKQKIVGGSVVNSNIVNSSELMKAIELSRVRWAPSRTKLVRVDVTSLNLFQSFVRQSGWAVQRCGILYGKYDSAESTIEVHAVYEPEQEGGLQKFVCLRDSRVGTVDRLAERLGLRRVGMVCTHQARDPDKMVLSGYELLLCAREQSRFGDECVLLTMSPSITTGRIECQAWQASPQAVHFYRLGTLTEKLDADPRNSTVVTGTADGFCGDEIPSHFVYSSISLEVAQEQTDDKGRPQVITKAPSKEIDTRWFTSYVAVDPFDSHVVKNLFVRISRPGMDPPTITNLRNYLKDPKRADVPILQKLADFHVLIFLAFDVFSGVNEVLTIIDAIKENSLAPLAEPHVKTLQLLIES